MGVKLNERTYYKATSPDQLVMLWFAQNAAVEREADQKAFDALPAELRQVVNDAPIQLACAPLLLGCRRYGMLAMREACQRLLAEWSVVR